MLELQLAQEVERNRQGDGRSDEDHYHEIRKLQENSGRLEEHNVSACA